MSTSTQYSSTRLLLGHDDYRRKVSQWIINLITFETSYFILKLNSICRAPHKKKPAFFSLHFKSVNYCLLNVVLDVHEYLNQLIFKSWFHNDCMKSNIVLNRQNNDVISMYRFLYPYLVFLMKICNYKCRFILKQWKGLYMISVKFGPHNSPFFKVSQVH